MVVVLKWAFQFEIGNIQFQIFQPYGKFCIFSHFEAILKETLLPVETRGAEAVVLLVVQCAFNKVKL